MKTMPKSTLLKTLLNSHRPALLPVLLCLLLLLGIAGGAGAQTTTYNITANGATSPIQTHGIWSSNPGARNFIGTNSTAGPGISVGAYITGS